MDHCPLRSTPMTTQPRRYPSRSGSSASATKKRRRGDERTVTFEAESRPVKRTKIDKKGPVDIGEAYSTRMPLAQRQVASVPTPSPVPLPNLNLRPGVGPCPLPSIREVFRFWPSTSIEPEDTRPTSSSSQHMSSDVESVPSSSSLASSTESSSKLSSKNWRKEEEPAQIQAGNAKRTTTGFAFDRNTIGVTLPHHETILTNLKVAFRSASLLDKMWDVSRVNFPSVVEIQLASAPLLFMSNSELFKLLRDRVHRHYLAQRPLGHAVSNSTKSPAVLYCACGVVSSRHIWCIAHVFALLLRDRFPEEKDALRMLEQETLYGAGDIWMMCEMIAKWNMELDARGQESTK